MCVCARIGFVALAAGALLGGCGGGGGSDSAGSSANRAPTGVTATESTTEDQPVTFTPDVKDPDAGDSHTFPVVAQPARGRVSASADKTTITYTPDPHFNGQESFTIQASDPAGRSTVGTATVHVRPVNDPPAAIRARFTVKTGSGLFVKPFVDDPDRDDTYGWIFDDSTLTHGTVSFTPGSNVLSYTLTDSVSALPITESLGLGAIDSGGSTVEGTAHFRVYGDEQLSQCTSASTSEQARTASHPCAVQGTVTTRKSPGGADVNVRYMLHHPSSTDAKAVVLLVPGRVLDPAIAGDPATGEVTATGAGFLTRSAQLVAEAGYLVVTVARPSDRPDPGAADPVADLDRYRRSLGHAVDLAAVLRVVNTRHQPVFLVGTDRGTLSAVANNRLAEGLALASPVTSADPGHPQRSYLREAAEPRLSVSHLQRPTFVTWHDSDACPVSAPVDAQALAAAVAAEVTGGSDRVSGGLPGSGGGCTATSFHGYLGVEPTAVGRITQWLDSRVAALAGNASPVASRATVPVDADTGRRIELASLVSEADGESLSYALPYADSLLGGTLELNGSVVTYTPPAGASDTTDAFVFVATDGSGGVGRATVQIAIQP